MRDQLTIEQLEAKLDEPIEIVISVGDGRYNVHKRKSQLVRSKSELKVPPLKKALEDVYVQSKRQRDSNVKDEIERIRERESSLKKLLEGQDTLTFAEFAGVIERHKSGYTIPGLEFIGQRQSYRYSYRSQSSASLSEVLHVSDKLAARDYDPTKPLWQQRIDEEQKGKGALSTKPLKDLTPEDCFVRVTDRGKAPVSQTEHSYVRRMLSYAVKMEIIPSNPASLKAEKEKASK